MALGKVVKTEEHFEKARKIHNKSLNKKRENAIQLNKVWEEKKKEANQRTEDQHKENQEDLKELL